MKDQRSVFRATDLPANGVLTGKFGPLTSGHINFVHLAATQVQKLWVVLSFDQKWIDNLENKEYWAKRLTLENRVKWLKRTFADMPHIEVIYVDETHIAAYPDGAKDWSVLVRKELNKNGCVSIDRWFSSEPEYSDWIGKYFPEAEHVIIDQDRVGVPISATMVRANPWEHWSYLPSVVREECVLKVLINGVESCVDGATEYFNGYKWTKIKDFKPGDKVLQYYDETGVASLTFPTRYIKEPCDRFIKLTNRYGTWSQVVSEDHDIAYITSKGNFHKATAHSIKQRHDENTAGFGGKFICTFNADGPVKIDHDRLRLMIAISADGTLARQKWRIRLKKTRKIERMRELIKAVGLELDERVYNETHQEGFVNFYLPKEFGVKVFPDYFYHLTKECQAVFIDEIFKWDGSFSDDTSRYFTTLKENHDVVQFILASNGLKTNTYIDKREGRTDCYCLRLGKTKYRSVAINDIVRPFKDQMVSYVPSLDGFKYCFTVPSGNLVLRRDGEIFVTGNCGKSSLTRQLAKVFNTAWVEEYGRTFCEVDLAGDEIALLPEHYGQIAMRRLEMERAEYSRANRVVFCDTSALVTQMFCQAYNNTRSELVDAIIRVEDYDIVLDLTSDIEWVDDGLRGQSGGTEKLNKNREYLDRLMAEFDIFKRSVVYSITGSFHDRLTQATAIIQRHLNGDVAGNHSLDFDDIVVVPKYFKQSSLDEYQNIRDKGILVDVTDSEHKMWSVDGGVNGPLKVTSLEPIGMTDGDDHDELQSTCHCALKPSTNFRTRKNRPYKTNEDLLREIDDVNRELGTTKLRHSYSTDWVIGNESPATRTLQLTGDELLRALNGARRDLADGTAMGIKGFTFRMLDGQWEIK